MRCPSLIPTLVASAAISAVLSATPALAHERTSHPEAAWKADRQHSAAPAMDPYARDAWLADCRQRTARRDNGVGGAVIGGLVGGVAGNRIAGRGNRTVGTVAGAAIGAAAGMAIDKAEDRNQYERDECESYLDDYVARYQAGYSGYGYGHYGYGQAYGYSAYSGGSNCCSAQAVMMVPAARQVRGAPDCVETVEYEYVDVPVRAAPRPAPRKRVQTAPDKRIRVK